STRASRTGPGMLVALDEEDATDHERGSYHPPQIHRMARVAHEPIMIEEERRDHLSRDDRRHEGGGAEPGRENDGGRHEEGAEHAAGPVPPERPSQRAGRDREPGGHDVATQRQRAYKEGNAGGQYRVPQRKAELVIHSGLHRQDDAGNHRKQKEPGHRVSCPESSWTDTRRAEQRRQRRSASPRSPSPRGLSCPPHR